MRNKLAVAVILLSFAVPGGAHAEQTIVTHETEKYFYKDGRMQKFEGQFEYTYLLDPVKNTLTRTRIYDYRSKEIKPDNTVYAVDAELISHPLRAEQHNLSPVLTATGRPSDRAVELLVIREDGVESTTAENGRVVVSRADRLS